MRVFWPQNCLAGLEAHAECLIVGWKTDDIAVVVTALPPLDVGLMARLLEQDTLIEKGSARQLYEPFENKRLSVLGSVSINSDPSSTRQLTSIQDWLDVTASTSDGEVLANARSLSIKNQSELCSVIIFDPPNPGKMHYLTLSSAGLYAHDSPKLKYSDELKFHSSHNKYYDTGKVTSWPAIVAQMNCVHDLKKQITDKARDLFPELAKDPNLITVYTRRRSLSITEAAKAVKRRSRKNVFSMIMRLRNLADSCLTLMERPMSVPRPALLFPPPANPIGIPSAFASPTQPQPSWSLRDLLCTFQQLHLRLNQLCYLPHQYITIVGMNSQQWHYMTPQRNEAYIRFYNMLWLAIYDWILGAYLWSVISANEEVLASMAFRGFNTGCEMLVVTTKWLMLWPAGFKLNTQLAQFMGEVIIWSILAWRSMVVDVLSEKVWLAMIHGIALSGLLGGAALQLSVVIDALYLLGLQMWVLYQSLARVYNQQLSALSALFRVFRGRKYNVLRNRVDSGNYDMHQLLMGTILFTVLLFLFPTVLAFYSVLAVIQLGVLVLIASLGVALAILNYFPLFPILLRIKSPQRLPNGVEFTHYKCSQCQPPNGNRCLTIQSQPMRVSEVFAQLVEAISGFVRESFNLTVFKQLILGQVVRIQPGKVYRSLYSVLPSQRGASAKLLAELSEYWGESL